MCFPFLHRTDKTSNEITKTQRDTAFRNANATHAQQLRAKTLRFRDTIHAITPLAFAQPELSA